ncbi:ATP-binding cassette domain-containing protein [Enterococcus sp. LJL128]
MIVFDNVSKIYEHRGGKTLALQEINLQIESGEIFGIIGESGSGKSTLLKLLSTLEVPDSGRLEVDGEDLEKLTASARKNRLRKTGVVFQHFNLLYNRTVRENVELPLKLAGKDNSQAVEEILRFVKIDSKAEVYPKQLSGGEKQRTAIARALVTAPNLLLCDEPTSALDGQHAYEVRTLLRKINHELGTTIIVVSHELELIQQLCNRAAIVEKGRLLETVTLDKKADNPVYASYYERIKEVLS